MIWNGKAASRLSAHLLNVLIRTQMFWSRELEALHRAQRHFQSEKDWWQDSLETSLWSTPWSSAQTSWWINNVCKGCKETGARVACYLLSLLWFCKVVVVYYTWSTGLFCLGNESEGKGKERKEAPGKAVPVRRAQAPLVQRSIRERLYTKFRCETPQGAVCWAASGSVF